MKTVQKLCRLLVAGCTLPMLLATPTARAATDNLVIGATVLSKSNCKFAAPASATIAFGTIDPSLAGAQTLSATFSFTCKGSAAVAIYDVSDNGGLYFAGGNRMRHATTLSEFLPYSLTLTPSSGSAPKNVAQTVTATVTIPVSSFQQAISGDFSDTVVITLNP